MDDKFEERFKDMIVLRGGIINEVIFLERVIDDFLSNYFCPDHEKRDEMMELILTNERYALGSKIDVLVRILEKHYNEFYKANPTIKGDLVFILEKRNVLAHILLDTTFNGIENETIGFIKYKNRKEIIYFKEDDKIGLNEKIQKYKYAIQKLTHPNIN